MFPEPNTIMLESPGDGADKDLAEKIYWILIEEGQHFMSIPLDHRILLTPEEVREIIRKHKSELNP